MQTAASVFREQVETAVRNTVEAVNTVVLTSAEQQHAPSGTTAVFAIVLEQHMLIGHLGDSKAVLCQQHSTAPTASGLHSDLAAGLHEQQRSASSRAGSLTKLTALPLTVDHLPDRPDEQARITAAGGTVSAATAGK